MVGQEENPLGLLRCAFQSLNIQVFQLLESVVGRDGESRATVSLCPLAQARQSVRRHPQMCSLHTVTYYASIFVKIVGDAFALHNGVTWFNASVSNVAQKSSADRSSGGRSVGLVDARQSRYLRTFSKRASW